MPDAIYLTRDVDQLLRSLPPGVRASLIDVGAHLKPHPHFLQGNRIPGHPSLREWFFDAEGKIWRITIDVRTGWPTKWYVVTLEEA